MGKIRTEGVGEVQEVVDIVSNVLLSRKAKSKLISSLVRLCSWLVENDEWQLHCVRKT
jgi:hypothetical protein